MHTVDLIQSVILPLSQLEVNKGQIEGLAKNPRLIRDDRYSKLKRSIEENPEMLALRECLVFPSGGKYVIVGGNMRYRAQKELGYTEIACKIIPPETPVEALRAYTIKDNAGFGEWDFDALANEWSPEDLSSWGVDFEPIESAAQSEAEQKADMEIRKLADDFIIPPFTVLSTRTKEWVARRKQWLDLGIESELGRDGDMTYGKTSQPPIYYKIRNYLKEKSGKTPTHEETIAELHSQGYREQKGVSVFDPVLTEISYRWFNVKHGAILDPFAGGSVRGIVAAKLGMKYVGNDLRKEQAEANRKNAKATLYDLDDHKRPLFTSGDSLLLDEILRAEKVNPEFDMIFSCPPYADLEVYSDNPKDLSNMDYPQFMAAYRAVIQKSCALLKDNRFAVFVVGDVRDKKGIYRNFVGDTVKAFTDCGLLYYNHLILVNQINSLAIRIRRQFQAARKAGKTHQNVLAFYKGNPEEMPAMFEQINLKKAIEQFNKSKENAEVHEDVLCFYKGNISDIKQEFGDVNNSDIS
jgi:DNA modification methylase